MPFIKQRYSIQKPTKAYLFLMNHINLTMAQAQSYISKGKVIYQDKVLSCADKNKILENSVEVMVFKPHSTGIKPSFENEDFALFNKPTQMLIHPKGRFNHHSLMDEIKQHCGDKAELIHRIDKETSGLVLVGKHKESIQILGEMFAKRKITKKYLALVRGKMPPYPFSIFLALSTQKKGDDLSIRSIHEKQDKPNLTFKEAKTSFEILGYYGNNTLLQAQPLTGRTHQIRVHLFSLGYPILGDPLYGCEDYQTRAYLESENHRHCTPQTKPSRPLTPQERLKYFGSTRLMLHSYCLKFVYKSKPYYFRSIQNFSIPQTEYPPMNFMP
ncbi:MAG: RluA family pseudouridine synthase [Helicobacter sp.]|nr:RluA family pseudouridine synthase [Helicobacter sp.]